MSGFRILLIDDDPQTAAFVARSLASHGGEVDFFQDVYDAVDELLLSGAGLVLLSADIPDGLAACTRIKSDPELRHLPVVVMSMDIEREDLAEHRADNHHRADLYLARPFDGSTLAHQLTTLLGLAEAPEAPATTPVASPEAEPELEDPVEDLDLEAIEFTDESPLPDEPGTDPELPGPASPVGAVESSHEELAALGAELEETRRQRDESAARSEQLAEELAQASAERDESARRLGQSRRERDAVIEELVRARRKREASAEDLVSLREAHERLVAAHEASQAELEALQARHQEEAGAAESLEAAERRLLELHQERNELADKLEDVERAHDELRARLQAEEKAATEARAELEPLRAKAARERGRAQALLGALSDRQEIEGAAGAAQELTRLATELAEARGQVAEIEEARDRDREESESLRAQLAEQGQIVATLREQERALSRALDEERSAGLIRVSTESQAHEEDDESSGLRDELATLRARLAEVEAQRDALHAAADSAPSVTEGARGSEISFLAPSNIEITSEYHAWVERARLVARRTNEALRKARAGLEAHHRTMQADLEEWRVMEKDLGVAVQALLRGGAGASPTQFNEPLVKLQRLLSAGSALLARRCAVEDSLTRLLEQITAAWKQTENESQR